MFPMGIRIWDQGRMVYPVKFSVYLDLEKNISSIKTLIEGKKYQTFNYMMLTTGIAINGYVYEKDIIMIDGEEDKVGIVEFDKMAGAFVVKIKDQVYIVNEAMEFCEILGNVYEDKYLLEEYKLTFNDNVITDTFDDIDDDFDEPIIEEVVTKEEKPEIKEETKPEKLNTKPEKVESQDLKEEIIEENIKEKEKEEEPINEPIIQETIEEPVIEEIIEEITPVIKAESIIEDIPDEVVEDIPESKESNIVEIPDFSDDVMEEEVDANIFMGAEELPFLDDEDIAEPIDEEIITEADLLDELEPTEEELPPDDIFGDGVIEEVKVPEPITAEEIVIYSYGYCAVDNGPGTYCYIIEADGKEVRNVSAGLDSTILNRIQLMGVTEAFKNIKEGTDIKVYSDSKYVVSPFLKGWIYKWQAKDWKKDTGEKVLNSDLWEEIYELTKDLSVEWIILKDANSNEQLAKCSENAKKEIEKFIK